MKEIEAIKAAIAAGPTPGPWPLIRACNPAAMQKIIEHIDAQQSEIERLREALKFYATVEDGTIAKLMLAAMKETP